eukprot:TRINITY_DN9306_c0_g1_i9.p3 TRINITY_DN9306_c0_g1~~TRINITY_DN9306_c0_g1_i9.p3  ORF type:complete len:209 (+),score=45.99 TRINITY_DN9306_c0_g1_i9:207-833(+)
MMKSIVCCLIVALAALASARDCEQREQQCLQRCGTYDLMDFDCKSSQNSFSSSCSCVSGPQAVAEAGAVISGTPEPKEDDTDKKPKEEEVEQQKVVEESKAEEDKDDGEEEKEDDSKSVNEDWCVDIVPSAFSCEKQKEWGQCERSWMALRNYCRKTCFGCTCEDVVPSGSPEYSCEQQRDWGKCDSAWMRLGRYCEKTCGRCGVPLE